MTEDQLLQNVRDTCKAFGLAVYHTHRSDRSEPGFPDLCIVGERVMFRELKSAKGKATPHQLWWLQLLADAGVDADLWRPEDWPDRIVAELRALGRPSAELPRPTNDELRRRLAKRKGRRRPLVVPDSHQRSIS